MDISMMSSEAQGLFLFGWFFLATPCSMQDPSSPAREAWNPNHWTTRELLSSQGLLFIYLFIC